MPIESRKNDNWLWPSTGSITQRGDSHQYMYFKNLHIIILVLKHWLYYLRSSRSDMSCFTIRLQWVIPILATHSATILKQVLDYKNYPLYPSVCLSTFLVAWEEADTNCKSNNFKILFIIIWPFCNNVTLHPTDTKKNIDGENIFFSLNFKLLWIASTNSITPIIMPGAVFLYY